MYVPQLVNDQTELRQSTEDFIASITPNLLIEVRKELKFILDIRRVPKYTHINHT